MPLTSRFDRARQVFVLSSRDGMTVQKFPMEDLMKYYLSLWQFTPGDKVGNKHDFTFEKLSISEEKVWLRDAAGEQVILQGEDEIMEFQGRHYLIQQSGSEEPHVTLDLRDPTYPPIAYYDLHNNSEKWTIRGLNEDIVTISKSTGVLNLEQAESLLYLIKQIIQSDPDQERKITSDYFANLNVDSKVRDIHQGHIFKHQYTKFHSLLMLALGAEQYQKLSQSNLQAAVPLPQYGNTIEEKFDRAVILHNAFDFLLSDEFSQKSLQPEITTLKQLALLVARADTTKKTENSPLAIEHLARFGNAEDLYNALILSLFRKGDLSDIRNGYKKDPEHILANVAELSETHFPGIDFIKIWAKYFRSENPETTNNMLSEISPSLRKKIAHSETPPEEKYRLLRVIGRISGGSIDIDNYFEQDGSIDPEFSKQLMMYLRAFRGIEEKTSPDELTDENILQFSQSLSEFKKKQDSNELEGMESVSKDIHILGFLARHPRELASIVNLSLEAPDFLELIKPGGELESNREQLIRYLFADGSVTERAKEIVSIFSGNQPMSERLIAFVEARLHDKLEQTDSNYPVMFDSAAQEKTPFSQLSYEKRITVLKQYLVDSLAISRSNAEKEQATERNSLAQPVFNFKKGMYIHGLSASILNHFLRNGNLCGEFLGPSSRADSYPFHVDFSYIREDSQIDGLSILQTISSTPTMGFGKGEENGHSTQVVAVTDRDIAKWEKETTYYAGYGESNHTLILGAVPATEVHAFLLMDPQGSLPHLIKACIEEEHYIPGYAIEDSEPYSAGQIVFTYEDYKLALQEAKPYLDGNDFIAKTDYLDDYDVPQSSGAHKYTLKNHLLLATEKAGEISSAYDLSGDERQIVQIAARLHDIGKGISGAQIIDNPLAASSFLSKIRGLSADNKELIFTLIKNDELLGDILQGKKRPEQFARLFPDARHRMMLLALYKADVQAIDGNTEDTSLYKTWNVEEKLKELELEIS